MIREFAVFNGYSPSTMEIPLHTSEGPGWALEQNKDWKTLRPLLNPKKAKTMTFQLVRLDENRTRVKARVSNVYYPPELEGYYNMIWEAVDKQIFVDRHLESEAVDKRE